MHDSDDPCPILVGDHIRITAGTFEGFAARVTGVDETARRIAAGIHIFGCVTPVEVGLDEVVKIDR